MKTKILLWFFVSTLMTSHTGLAQDTGHPQVITMDDGTKLTYLGVTYGTRHWPPQYEAMGGRTGNWLYTPSNTPVVWIEAEHDSNASLIYELLVSDTANTACVNTEICTRSHVKTGVDIQGFRLDAFPRWDKETILRVQLYRGPISKGHFVMTNPAPGSVANWTPKPLPDTESDGDLEVTLNKLVAGVPMPHNQGRTNEPVNDPANRCVHLNFDFRQNGQSTSNWYPWPVRTSDAFGNYGRGLIYDYPKNGIYPDYPDRIHPSFPPESDGHYYQPGLWPDAPAWKVRLEFIQRSGFSDAEMVTFTNIPVRFGSQQDADGEWTWDTSNTNFAFIAQGAANGVQLKLLPPLLVPNSSQPGQKYLSVLIFADSHFNPEEMNLTVVQATDDQGRDIWSPFGIPWAGHYSLDFPNVHDDIKSLNLTLALHKSRFVEFTVKPAKQ